VTDAEGSGTPPKAPLSGRRPLPSWLRRYWSLCAIAVAVVASIVIATQLSNAPDFATGTRGVGGSHVTGEPSGKANTGRSANTASGQQQSQSPEQMIASVMVPPALAAKLKKWNAGGGGAALDKVSYYMTAAAQSGGMKLYPSMREDCSSLYAAIFVAKASPRLPSATIQGWYNTALADLTKAATKCQAAISVQQSADGESVQTQEKSSLLRSSESGLARGAKDLYRVTVQLAASLHSGTGLPR
jgi:hypothetical protein